MKTQLLSTLVIISVLLMPIQSTGIMLAKSLELSVLTCMVAHDKLPLQRLQDVLGLIMQEKQVHTKRTRHSTDIVNSKMIQHLKWQS